MYCGYNLRFVTEGRFNDSDFADSCYNQGLARFTQHKTQIETVLDGFALRDGTLDGTAIQDNWFPQIKADIFISHAHSDERTVIIFAEILKRCFGLTSFIDSCVWGYSTDLLKIIDNEYCRNSYGNTYNYTKRNFSTSHVHMMLSTALMMMMDNCECVFFIDTPNSVNTEDVIKRTRSPWIYSEINMSRLIKRHLPHRKHRVQDSLQKSSAENFSSIIEYELNTSHFTEMTERNFGEWINQRETSKIHSLDILYKLLPIKTQGAICG
jgi:hypothetical protein